MDQRSVGLFAVLLAVTVLSSRVTAQSNPACRVDIAFVVDNSGSIRDSNVVGQPDNFNLVLDFMKRITERVTVTAAGNRIASVSFGNNAKVNFLLNAYDTTQNVVNAISAISYMGGNTNTTGALRVMREQVFTQPNGDRPEVPNVCILITDGIPTREVEQLPAEVQLNKNLGTRILGVGVTMEVNEAQLKTIVSNPTTDYYYVSDFTGLASLLDGITDQACRTVTPATPSVATQPLPTFATLPAGSCVVDIAFVVDNSGSIRDNNIPGQRDNFDQVKQFMKDIVQVVQVSQNGNKFACVSYGNTAVVNFYFNQYSSTQAVMSAIDGITYLGGNTNTTGGLRLMRQDIFTQAHGDRPQVPNLCILITDGKATREVAELPNEVRRIKDLGTIIIGIGVSAEVNEQELKDIVSNPATDYFYVSNFTGLYGLLDATINSACRTFPTTPPLNPTNPDVVPQTSANIRTLAPGTVCNVDVAFVVDNSGSIRDSNVVGQPDNFQLILDFMRTIVQTIQASPDGNHFASVSFGNTAIVNFLFNTHRTTSDVLAAINAINYLGGNTNTTGALRLLRQQVFQQANGDRPDIPNICLLITDGTPTREVAELPAEVQLIKSLGTRIIGVGVSNAVNETQLKAIVSNPNTDYFYVSNFTGLYGLLDLIVNSACQSFPSTIRPATATTTAARPQPTTARDPSGSCSSPVDLILVIDDSGSIGPENFLTLKSFLNQLVADLNVESGGVRVGLMTFSDNPEPRFNLDVHKSRAALTSAIMALTFYGGHTNTPVALRYVRTTMLTAAAGSRAGVPKLVIVVTDGGSTEKQATQDEAYALRNTGATVVVVGVGKWLDMLELNNIASYPYSENRIVVSQYSELSSITSRLSSIACSAANKCSTSPCQNGGTCLQDLQAYNCLCRSGSSGQDCQQSCRVGADIAFIMDSSLLVGVDNFQSQLDFIRSLVYSLNVNMDSRVALLVASDQSYIRFNLNDLNSQQQILNGISQYYPGNKSDLAQALRLARTNVFGSSGDRPGVPNIIVIITYRGSTNETVAVTEARLARGSGIQILGVGVGSMVKREELNALVSYPALTNAQYVDTPSSIQTLVGAVTRAMCNEVNECSSNPCRNGGQCTDQINGYTCTCTSSYTGVNCERPGNGRIDLNIVLDSSGSIRSERFPYILKFIMDIVEQLEVSPDKTRVGLIQYSSTAREVFRLNAFDNKQDVMDAVKRTGFMGGRTNAAAALKLLQQMFSTSYGGRPNAQDVALFFSDGNWNEDVPDTVPAAVAARAAGVHIIVFSVGTDSDYRALQAIASEPTGSTILQAASATDISRFIDSVLKATVNDVNDCASNPCQNGGTCVDDVKRYVCRCSLGYTGPTCNRRCSRQMDVTLILDLSQYLRQEILDLVVPLAKSIVQGLPVQSDLARVSIVTYAYNATVVCNLNTYSTGQDILNVMSFAKSESARSNLQGALRLLYQNVYTSGRGDRDTVSNLVIALTDGFTTPSDPSSVAELAGNARSQAAVELFVIGLGDTSQSANNINALANGRSDRIASLRTAADMEMVSSQVLGWLCNPTVV